MADLSTVEAKLQIALADAAGFPTVEAKVQTALDEAIAAAGLPVPIVHRVPFNETSAIYFDAHYNSGSAYQRRTYHVCLTADTFSIAFGTTKRYGTLPLAYPQYALYFGDGLTLGEQRATYVRQSTERGGNFVGTLGTLADGPYMLTVVPLDASGAPVAAPTESPVPFWVWVDRGGTARNHPDVIFQNGSYDWFHSQEGTVYLWMRVPKVQMKTRTVPLDFRYIPTVDTAINSVVPHRFYGGEPFNTAVPNTKLAKLLFANCSENNDMNVYRPVVTARGITVTENNQAYSVYDFFAEQPNQPQLDGPRGQAVVTNPNAIWVGHGGTIYGCDGHSFWKVNFRGDKTIFAGIRHKYAPYWEEIQPGQPMHPACEIVGDWDASIPPERRWPWESWGLVFDLRASKQDFSLPLVNLPPFGDLPQHLGIGPVAFCTCRFGRILKFQFHKDRPTDPPTITEWVTGLNDPWGMAIDGNVLYVCERLSHKITMWSADDGSSLGTVLENPKGDSFGYMDTARRKWTLYDTTTNGLANARAQTILAPEGLAVQDGYLYWGCRAQGEVRRVNLTTKAVEICVRQPFFDGDQPHFIAIGLSDGTFGPRGTIFSSTADNQYQGRPYAFPPLAGTASDGTPLTHSKQWNWSLRSQNVLSGPSGSDVAVYPMAVGVGNGMLAHGSSGYGLDVFMLAAPLGLPAVDVAACQRGHLWYSQKGYRLLYGNYGWGYVDVPLPWGENPDCDAMLRAAGHS